MTPRAHHVLTITLATLAIAIMALLATMTDHPSNHFRTVPSCTPVYGVNACQNGRAIPEVNVPATTAPTPGCPYSALSVTPDYASGYPQTHFIVSDGTGPTMLIHAHNAAEALSMAQLGWADSYGEMECAG